VAVLVGLQRDGLRIACEVSITSDAAHELGNIEKCLKDGYDHVVLCSPYRKTLNSARKLVSNRLPDAESERVLFLEPEQGISFLEETAAQSESKETTIKGCKVNVQYVAVGQEEKRTKRQAVGQVILRALQRMKEN